MYPGYDYMVFNDTRTRNRYNMLDLPEGLDLVDMASRLRAWENRKPVLQIVDGAERRYIPATTMNAMYSPSTNEVYALAGMLQVKYVDIFNLKLTYNYPIIEL